MKLLISILAAALSLATITSAHAADKKQPSAAIGKAEAKILAKFKQKYPATSVANISKSPVKGVYEVIMGRNIAYTDADANYLIFGHVFDMASQRDLTQEKIDEMNKVNFSSLPLDKAIKVVKGDGSRVFAVFTDPDCTFCKRLERESLAGVDNYTMYVFMFPIPSIHPEAEAKADAIWCANDQVAAWRDYMLKDKMPESVKADCKTPTRDVMAIGQSLNVNGTPTLYRVDGASLPGAYPTEEINNWLNGKLVRAGR